MINCKTLGPQNHDSPSIQNDIEHNIDDIPELLFVLPFTCTYCSLQLVCNSLESVKHIDMHKSRVHHVVCIYTVSPKKTCDYDFYNNFNNTCPITIIFGIVSSKSMRHRKMVSFPTLPIQCNYLTLGNHRTQKMTNFAVSNILFCE